MQLLSQLSEMHGHINVDINVRDLPFTVGLSAFSILTPRLELVIPGVLYVYFVLYIYLKQVVF